MVKRPAAPYCRPLRIRATIALGARANGPCRPARGLMAITGLA